MVVQRRVGPADVARSEGASLDRNATWSGVGPGSEAVHRKVWRLSEMALRFDRWNRSCTVRCHVHSFVPPDDGRGAHCSSSRRDRSGRDLRKREPGRPFAASWNVDGDAIDSAGPRPERLHAARRDPPTRGRFGFCGERVWPEFPRSVPGGNGDSGGASSHGGTGASNGEPDPSDGRRRHTIFASRYGDLVSPPAPGRDRSHGFAPSGDPARLHAGSRRAGFRRLLVVLTPHRGGWPGLVRGRKGRPRSLLPWSSHRVSAEPRGA
jgi:hypothetical protein